MITGGESSAVEGVLQVWSKKELIDKQAHFEW